MSFAMLAVTNWRSNQSARRQAELLKVRLIEGDQLVEIY